MDKPEENIQNDSKNKQSPSKILRAHDIFPPADKKKSQNIEPLHPSTKDGQTYKEEHIHPEIPKFDLANEIMAEHRKKIANKRTAPADQITPAQAKKEQDSAGNVIERPLPEDIETDKIIKQIVAKDIERLYNAETA